MLPLPPPLLPDHLIPKQTMSINYQTTSHNPPITTEEEFKCMENAVNNLLISKKQIDNLKRERNSIIQIYENKIKEQNEQIKYLQEENSQLKSIKITANNNNNAYKTCNCDSNLEHKNWRKNYEICLDNVMRQLLNTLKVQETIRVEYSKLQTKPFANTNKNTNTCKLDNNDAASPASCLSFNDELLLKNSKNTSFCTSNSWTFEQKKHHISNKSEMNDKTKFQELLLLQQKQQLNLLNELSEISKGLRTNIDIDFDLLKSQTNLNHSELNSPTTCQPSSTQDSDTSCCKSNLLSISSASKPSKIPKYNRNSSACSSTSSTSKTYKINRLKEPKINLKNQTPNQIQRFKSLSSKIPQRSIPKSSQTHLNKSIESQSSSNTQPLNYSTYTKKKNSSQSNDKQTSKNQIINSGTFDKLDKLGCKLAKDTVNDYLINECKEVKILFNKNCVDILLVPVVKLNCSEDNSSSSIPVVVRSKDDEGYSTMSSEIMHQIRLNNSAATSCRSSTNNETNTDSGIRMSRASGGSTNIDETSSTTSSTTANHSPLLTDDENLLINLTSSTIASQLKNSNRKKKRYCFPTIKSFNYYYSNRYYHQYHVQNQSQNSLNSKSQWPSLDPKICCKYLSETDIQALSNQLSSYDKDLSYNVYHLDTLYNNVDYILFNSYASDTELVYNYNRRNGRYQHFLNSNYKLYINDYFNQPYEEEDEDDETEDESENENENEIQNEIKEELEENTSQTELNILADYELKDEDEYQFELDYTYNNSQQMIELNVDDDGLLFDDEDVNLLLMIKKSQQDKLDENGNENDTKSTRFNLNEYCQTMIDENMFESRLNSPIFSSSQTLSSLNTSTGSSSCSSACSSCSSHQSSTSSTSELSVDSINPKHLKKKLKVKSGHKCRRDKVNSHKHRRHRQHDYFTDSIDKYCENDFDMYAKVVDIINKNGSVLNTNINPNNFDLDDFVHQLNVQCKIDKALAATERTSKHLKELNMIAAARVVQNTGVKHQEPKHAGLVRRHTITSIPVSAAGLEFTNKNQSRQDEPVFKISPISACQSPTRKSDSKAYVGSFTNPTNSRASTPHRKISLQQRQHNQELIANRNSFIQISNKLISSVGSTPLKVKNNFNNDFYRLCSETFYYGSDQNLLLNTNQSLSNGSLHYQLQLLQQQSGSEKNIANDYQTNLSTHVNTLFDQWLLNSSTASNGPR